MNDTTANTDAPDDNSLSDTAADMLHRWLVGVIAIVRRHGSKANLKPALAEVNSLRDELLAEDREAAVAGMKAGIEIMELARDRRRTA